jgi:hypothetical protein
MYALATPRRLVAQNADLATDSWLGIALPFATYQEWTRPGMPRHPAPARRLESGEILPLLAPQRTGLKRGVPCHFCSGCPPFPRSPSQLAATVDPQKPYYLTHATGEDGRRLSVILVTSERSPQSFVGLQRSGDPALVAPRKTANTSYTAHFSTMGNQTVRRVHVCILGRPPNPHEL